MVQENRKPPYNTSMLSKRRDDHGPWPVNTAQLSLSLSLSPSLRNRAESNSSVLRRCKNDKTQYDYDICTRQKKKNPLLGTKYNYKTPKRKAATELWANWRMGIWLWNRIETMKSSERLKIKEPKRLDVLYITSTKRSLHCSKLEAVEVREESLSLSSLHAQAQPQKLHSFSLLLLLSTVLLWLFMKEPRLVSDCLGVRGTKDKETIRNYVVTRALKAFVNTGESQRRVFT